MNNQCKYIVDDKNLDVDLGKKIKSDFPIFENNDVYANSSRFKLTMNSFLLTNPRTRMITLAIIEYILFFTVFSIFVIYKILKSHPTIRTYIFHISTVYPFFRCKNKFIIIFI